MITDEILLNNGYIKYNDSLYYNAECLFQKRIKDSQGKTKYFIDIYKYELPGFDEPDYEVRLVTGKENYNLNILYYGLNKNMTLASLESEVEYTWVDLGCNYYGDDE